MKKLCMIAIFLVSSTGVAQENQVSDQVNYVNIDLNGSKQSYNLVKQKNKSKEISNNLIPAGYQQEPIWVSDGDVLKCSKISDIRIKRNIENELIVVITINFVSKKLIDHINLIKDTDNKEDSKSIIVTKESIKTYSKLDGFKLMVISIDNRENKLYIENISIYIENFNMEQWFRTLLENSLGKVFINKPTPKE